MESATAPSLRTAGRSKAPGLTAQRDLMLKPGFPRRGGSAPRQGNLAMSVDILGWHSLGTGELLAPGGQKPGLVLSI